MELGAVRADERQLCKQPTMTQNTWNTSGITIVQHTSSSSAAAAALASGLIYAPALLEYVIFTLRVRSFGNILPSMKYAEDKVLVFVILHDKC